ncbi:MAG: D-alanyl-D-alanine carboxypeptidase family protein [Candidatus Dormibacteria bacterium]
MPRPRTWGALLALVLLGSAGAGAAFQLRRPLPTPRLRSQLGPTQRVAGQPPQLTWPSAGEASLYLDGYGWLGSSPEQGPVPIASVTKMMTALVVLRAHPLAAGAPGPDLAVGAQDQLTYQQELAAGDSVVPVAAGQPITEEQALQGLLVASGDNLALLLADWVSGSEPDFVGRMNQLARRLGLEQTHFADSSGLDPGSSSSARDLITLARAALELPAFAAVVRLPSESLPLGGVRANYNPILGQDGVVGVKTGWTSAALGCLVFAARVGVAGRPATLVGAVLGQPGGPSSGLAAAGTVALALLAQAEAHLTLVRVPGAGSRVGRMAVPWHRALGVLVGQPLRLVVPGGAILALRLRFRPGPAPWGRDQSLGQLQLRSGAMVLGERRLQLGRRVAGPSWEWRLLHF